MADTVTTTVLNDGPVNYVVHCTNSSDGTGEVSAVKVDVSSMTPVPTEVSILKIEYSTQGMAVNVYFDATVPVLAAALPANHSGCFDFCEVGGLRNTSGAGKTGDITVTTSIQAGSSYSITFYCRKH